MYVYREKDNLIYKLHPLTMVIFSGLIIIMALFFSHPLYLLALFLAVGLVIVASGNLQNWKVYLKFSFFMLVIIMFINVLFSQAGTTVLFEFSLFEALTVKATLEALVYGIGMGLRLLTIISAFCLFNYVVDPDKLVGFLGRWGNKSVLVLSLSARLFPLMVTDFHRITEVQRCRGVKYDTGSWIERIKNMLPVCSVFLLSCLERSLEMAESMYLRAYGSGNRTYYGKEVLRLRDYILLFIMITVAIIGGWTVFKGWSVYAYYPVLNKISWDEVATALVIAFVLSFPAILNWGWMRWPILKSKI